MEVYIFSRWRPSTILDFLKFVILTAHALRQNASSCQILCKSVKALRRYGRFRFFKMAAVRHFRFFKVGNSNCAYSSEVQSASPCQILCRSVEPLRRYGRLHFSRWRPSAILDFKKFKILTAHARRRAKMHHHAKFCANRSRCC